MSNSNDISKRKHRISPALEHAVEMAKTLRMPLLITGEPGVGKSTLAEALADRNDLPFFRTSVHSDTQFRDLFYRFDDIARFSAANIKGSSAEDLEPQNFTRFRGFGAAILQTMQARPEWLQPSLRGVELKEGACSSVVLIDEIDKAPRDVPNDLLDQLDQWRFEVREFETLEQYPQKGFEADKTLAPLVIITSNEERGLPDAFTRRCVYHHLELPPKAADAGDNEPSLELIVTDKLIEIISGERAPDHLVAESVSLFVEIRALVSGRKPGLAELLNWVQYLYSGAKRPTHLTDIDVQKLIYAIESLLLKSEEDRNLLDTLRKAGTVDKKSQLATAVLSRR